MALRIMVPAFILAACSSGNTEKLVDRGVEPQPARVISTMVEMRDGTELETYVYLPAGSGPFPTLVNRTIYGLPISPIGGYPGLDLDEDDLTEEEAVEIGWPLINDRGYALVIQVTRGRFNSGGIDRSWLDDANDGYDLIEWVAEQDWSDGRIGIFGDSAVGISALQAAGSNPPSLDAVYVQVTPGNPFGGDFMPEDGASKVETLMVQGLSIAFDTSEAHWTAMGLDDERVGQILEQTGDYLGALFGGLGNPTASDEWMALPLGGDQIVGELMPFWNSLFDRSVEAGYRDALDVAGKVNVPTFVATLWQDVFLDSTIEFYEDLQSRAVPSRLLVFNGSHYDIDDPALWPEPVMLDWFDHWLLGLDNGVYSGNRVDYAVQGSEEEWRTAAAWPPAGSVQETFYLTADGALDAMPAATADVARSYIYDPADPVVTSGGRHLLAASGSTDVAGSLARDDVLVYSSATLDDDKLIAGDVRAELFVSTEGIDTDFAIQLIDRHPDGAAVLVVEDLVRLSRRNGRMTDEFVQPGSVVRVELTTGDIAHRFAAGHRIELAVTSSNFPAWDRNLNNGLSSFSADAYAVVTNSVFSGSGFQSRLSLPVVTTP
jgi:putative CocE/NonD family hydrolase